MEMQQEKLAEMVTFRAWAARTDRGVGSRVAFCDRPVERQWVVLEKGVAAGGSSAE